MGLQRETWKSNNDEFLREEGKILIIFIIFCVSHSRYTLQVNSIKSSVKKVDKLGEKQKQVTQKMYSLVYNIPNWIPTKHTDRYSSEESLDS